MTKGSKLEVPFRHFDIAYPARLKHLKGLESILGTNSPMNPVPKAILDYILAPQPGKKRPRCQTVVVERRYYDTDHARAIGAFYNRSFRQVPRECTRLHLFDHRYKEEAVANGDIDHADYMGYVVIRPFAVRKVGRTVLRRYPAQPMVEFPTCKGRFGANLAGLQLTVDGPAFMEQETMVSACASVALWSSVTTLSNRFGLPAASTAEITELANQYWCQNRPIPSEGLLPEQMTQALRALGYEPLVVPVGSILEARDTVYSYVESEIPPILLCRLASGGFHAVVAVGHGYEPSALQRTDMIVEWADEEPLRYLRSSCWVPHFFVNDDQRGPFRKLQFLQLSEGELLRRIRKSVPQVLAQDLDMDEWHSPLSIDMDMPALKENYGETIANLEAVMVPLPRNVLLTAEQAEKRAAALLRHLHWLKQIPLPDDLVLRTYLIPSNEYKQHISSSQMNPFIVYLLRGKPMPKWIWVTEASSQGAYDSTQPDRWLIRGQVIIDATSSPLETDFLAIHYLTPELAIFASMTPEHVSAEEALAEYYYSTTDTPYPGWIR